jgi:Ca-activated chloride channel homolog
VRKVIPVVIFAAVFLLVAIRNCSSSGSRDVVPATSAVDVVPEPADPGVGNLAQTWPPLGGAAVSASPSSDINYYIVVDGSGSMKSHECGDGVSKMEAAVQAVGSFIETAPATANIGLAAFDRRAISERVALGVGNRESLVEALQHIQAGSGTPLNSGIRIGYNRLTDQARKQLGYGEYHLIVVTDGRPEPSSEDPTPVVREILRNSPVVVHTIGFCIDSNHVLNQQGRTYYASATSPQELQSSLQAVLAEAPTFDVARFQ